MIDPEERLYAASGNLLNGGPYTWYITDFDTRRYFSVTYAPTVPLAEDDLEATEDICMGQLQRHIDDLDDGVVGIRFSEPDGPITISTDPVDDVTHLVNCHQLNALQQLPFSIKTIFLSQLTELDRLGPQVDLVEYKEAPSMNSAQSGPQKTKAVFKYWLMVNGMFRTWFELNDWIRLPRNHPYIVPFDCVVLDDSAGIVGFTSVFIPGGTLKDNNATTRTFRLRWLHQLLAAIDDLNYQYGIMHQDIAPRNLVIDEQDNLRIIDFNFATMIKHYSPDLDDLKGAVFTLYEIITLDTTLRQGPPSEQNPEALLLQATWLKHPEVKLDHDVQLFRLALESWVQTRKAKEFKPLNTWVTWPNMPQPPKAQVLVESRSGDIIEVQTKTSPILFRRHLLKMGEPFWNWERPASYRLRDALASETSKSNSVRENHVSKANGDQR